MKIEFTPKKNVYKLEPILVLPFPVHVNGGLENMVLRLPVLLIDELFFETRVRKCQHT